MLSATHCQVYHLAQLIKCGDAQERTAERLGLSLLRPDLDKEVKVHEPDPNRLVQNLIDKDLAVPD